MPVTFENADDSTMKLLGQLVKKLHKPLLEAKVEIDVQFASAEEGAPAIKISGYDAYGKIKFITVDQRAKGAADVRLQIDQHQWENVLSVDEREALMDHLLQQIEVRTTAEKGEIIRDTAGRPKLKRRKFDLMIGGFSRVAEEHGKASIEAKAFAKMSETFHQLKLFEEVQKMRAVG